MGFGYDRAHQTQEKIENHEFECDECGPVLIPTNKTYKFKKRALEGTEVWRCGPCPVCKAGLRIPFDGPEGEACSRKPTKPFKKHGQTYMIHGRPKWNTIPADLKETLEQEQKLKAQRANGDDDGEVEIQHETQASPSGRDGEVLQGETEGPSE